MFEIEMALVKPWNLTGDKDICAFCRSFGDLMCERCNEIYCSTSCQQNDWREHRRQCIPMPRLVSRPYVRASLATTPNVIGQMVGYDAIDTAKLNGSSDQLTTKEQIVKVTEVLSDLQLDKKPKVVSTDIPAQTITKKNDVEGVPAAPPTTPQLTADSPPCSKLSKEMSSGLFLNRKSSTFSQKSNNTSLAPVPASAPTPLPAQAPSAIAIENNSNVFITHFTDPHTVYVHPVEDRGKWLELTTKINKYAKVAEELKCDPTVGDIVLIQSKKVDSFARGLIKKTRSADKKLMVELLDYGMTDVISQSSAKQIDVKLANEPRLVNKMTLKGVPDMVENRDGAIAFLENLQEKEVHLIAKHVELIEKTNLCAHISGELFQPGADISVNQEMQKPVKHVKTVDDDMSIESNVAAKEIEFNSFKGENIELLIVDNSTFNIGYFSGIKSTDAEQLIKNDDFINADAGRLEAKDPFMPKEGEVCLVKSPSDNRWYRANVYRKYKAGEYGILYLDYGNLEDVKYGNIREMEDKFMFPRITPMIYIDGIPEEKLGDGKLVERLEEYFGPYSKIKFDKIECTANGDATCTSAKLIEMLKNENFI